MNFDNPCKQIGCDICCRFSQGRSSMEEVSRMVPPGTNAIMVPQRAAFESMMDSNNREQGLVYLADKGTIDEYRKGQISGQRQIRWFHNHFCNCLEDGECTIYNNRPEICEKTEFGGRECNAMRRIHGNLGPAQDMLLNMSKDSINDLLEG
jgi:Fe-S-cluster containining protein